MTDRQTDQHDLHIYATYRCIKMSDPKKSPGIITFEIFQQVANSVDEMIQFAIDVQSKTLIVR